MSLDAQVGIGHKTLSGILSAFMDPMYTLFIIDTPKPFKFIYSLII
jgi:hypothetical protein